MSESDRLVGAVRPGESRSSRCSIRLHRHEQAGTSRDVRQALSDEAHRVIKTVPRRGYLFCVEPIESASTSNIPPPPRQSIEFCRTKDGVKLAMASTGLACRS